MERHSNKTNFPYVELSKLFALQAAASGLGVATSAKVNVDVQGAGVCGSSNIDEVKDIVQKFVKENGTTFSTK